MRRLIRALATALGAISITACTGGGSALNFSAHPSPDHVIITVAGPQNIARVIPGAGLALSAVQVNGSQNGSLSGNNFRWSAALTAGSNYPSGTPGGSKPCAPVLTTSGGITAPYSADFGIYIAIDPVNEANIIFFPPTILPAPAGSTLTTNYPYCVTINAEPGVISGSGINTKFNPTGPPGSLTVVVADPANPLK